MEPIFGFLLYLAIIIIVAIIAAKRGVKWVLYFFLMLAGGPAAVMLTSAFGASSVGAGTAAFLVPAIAIVVIFANKSAQDKAAQIGSYGDFKKCPFCAESVRKEAIKCKHCGSALPS